MKKIFKYNAPERRIIKVISDTLNWPLLVIDATYSLKGNMGIDSLDMVELAVAFEEEYGREITDYDSEMWETVQDIFDYIKKNKFDKDY